MDKLIGRYIVADTKVSGYLLNASHPRGGPKAKFFADFGFVTADTTALVDALLDHPQANRVVSKFETEFGIKRVVECHIHTPDGRDPCIRTVWMQDHGEEIHRLVTAIPLKPR